MRRTINNIAVVADRLIRTYEKFNKVVSVLSSETGTYKQKCLQLKKTSGLTSRA